MYREQKKLVLDTFFVPQNTRTDRFLLFTPFVLKEKNMSLPWVHLYLNVILILTFKTNMKVLFCIFLISLMSQLSWVDDVKAKIKWIDETAVLKKEDKTIEKGDIITYQLFKCKNAQKFVFDGRQTVKKTFEFNSTFFNQEFLYSDSEHSSVEL